MQRNIYETLLNWKESNSRKPLLLRGARQIGKTFTILEFGKKEFKNCVLLNFERNPEYKAIFKSLSPEEIIEKISIYVGVDIQQGTTLLFLDEIQDCPQAIMAMRYFYEEMPGLHIIGAGSFLEFSLVSENYRMPVGRVQYMYMYPLTFGEFLTAIGEANLENHISSVENLQNLPEELHNKLISLVRKYMIIGGMPEVVKEYVASKSILKCQKIQHSIIETYQDDFGKYAKTIQHKYLRKIFTAIPARIGDKVVYANIDKTVKSRDLKNAYDLLRTAGILYKVKRTTAGIPFEANVKENFYKTIFLDIGLMHAMNGILTETIQEEDLTAVYKGAVAEQFVGQEIVALQNNDQKSLLYYWARESKNSNAEIDFLLQRGSKRIPIEVKSGKNGHLKSLHSFLDTFKMTKGVKISQAPFKSEGGLESVPFYGVKAFLREKK